MMAVAFSSALRRWLVCGGLVGFTVTGLAASSASYALLPADSRAVGEAPDESPSPGVRGGNGRPAPSAVPTRPPKPAVGSPAPESLRYLPADPVMIALVQVSAADNFFSMLTGPAATDDTTDALKGMLMLLKDQIEGPLAVGMYLDATGKPDSAVVAAHLKQPALTREMLGGIAQLGGGDAAAGPKKTVYKGQTLFSMDLPKGSAPASIPVTVQPTFGITDLGFLIIGTSLSAAQRSLDSAAKTAGGVGTRVDIAAMMKELPLTPTTDVWLFVPKPTGSLSALPGVPKLPMNLPLGGVPLGATVATIRFTASGVRFEGLASVDRTTKSKQASR